MNEDRTSKTSSLRCLDPVPTMTSWSTLLTLMPLCTTSQRNVDEMWCTHRTPAKNEIRINSRESEKQRTQTAAPSTSQMPSAFLKRTAERRRSGEDAAVETDALDWPAGSGDPLVVVSERY